MADTTDGRDGAASTRSWGHAFVGAAGALLVCAAALAGVRASGAGERFDGAARAVILSVPGLRWQDLEATDTPVLDSLLGSSALLSTRAGGMELDLLEGYLTFNSGNTLEPDWSDSERSAVETAAGPCVPELAAAGERGVDELTGAEIGALGSALREAGVERRVFGGPAAVAALMDSDGCVDISGRSADAIIGEGVTLIELGGLEATDDQFERRRILEAHDDQLRSIAVPGDAVVIVMAPVGPTAVADVTVVAIRGSGGRDAGDGVLASATTRRGGYLRTTDLAPTVLTALGIDVPSSMVGTFATSFDRPIDLDGRVAEHADIAERVAFRDRAIWPVSVAVVLATLACLCAALVRRVALARWSACTALALVAWSFVCGAVPSHHLPLWLYLVALLAASIASAWLSLVATQQGPFSSVDALGVTLWVVLMVDVITGGRLQINTPLGYSPTVAGRFQGIGNLAFAILAMASLLAAVVPQRVAGGARQRVGRWTLLWVAAMSSVVVAAPRFGSDVGGTLALVPAFVVAAAMVGGERAPWRQLVLAGIGTTLGVLMLGLLDRSRPAGEQTHLGRFVDRILTGDAGPILRRKLRSNVELFTASVWPTLLLVALAVVAVVLWRHRGRAREVLRGRDAERAFIGGFAVVAVLGFLLNDSGVAVPAMMLAVGVPWIVVSLAPRGQERRT